MILFSNQPDSILDGIIRMILDTIVNDGKSSGSTETDNFIFFVSDSCLSLFGGPRTFWHIVRKLQSVYLDNNMYEVSPYFHYLLDDLVTGFTEIYNDTAGDSVYDDLVMHPSGKKIMHIDDDMIRDYLYHDQDFCMPPDLAFALSGDEEKKTVLGAQNDALNVAMGRSPDTKDLWIKPYYGTVSSNPCDELDWFSYTLSSDSSA